MVVQKLLMMLALKSLKKKKSNLQRMRSLNLNVIA